MELGRIKKNKYDKNKPAHQSINKSNVKEHIKKMTCVAREWLRRERSSWLGAGPLSASWNIKTDLCGEGMVEEGEE
jgi:hypothetical protein